MAGVQAISTRNVRCPALPKCSGGYIKLSDAVRTSSHSQLCIRRGPVRLSGRHPVVQCQVAARTASPARDRDIAQPQPQEQEPQRQYVSDMWRRLAIQQGDKVAVHDPHHNPAVKLSYRELELQMVHFAAGLKALGLEAGDTVSLFSENSARWLVADQGVWMNGAADAVRGTTSPKDELAYIISHSGSCGLIVQDNAALEKLLPALGSSGNSSSSSNGSSSGSSNGSHRLAGSLKFIVVLWGDVSHAARSALGSLQPRTFNDVISLGARRAGSFRPASVSGDTLATIVYTSGTTGQPKGVMLTHGNIQYQVDNLDYFLDIKPGDATLSLLPPWHIYERTCGYYIFSRAATQVYTNLRKFRDDLATHPPDYFVCVPLVLDTLYTKVKAALKRGSRAKRAIANAFLGASGAYVRARRVTQGVCLDHALEPPSFWAALLAAVTAAVLAPVHALGRRLVYGKIREALGVRKACVSGGGSLAPHLDDYYETLGITVLNGWGLTETSPVLACRQQNPPLANVRGSVGRPIPGTQLRVVDPETLAPLPDGQAGAVLARGPGIMAGYLNDESSTAKAFRAGDGWFDTGDLGWQAPEGVPGSKMGGVLVLTGRAKDTIVLSNGENVEPQPIEDALACSPYIKSVLLFGQDLRALGALIAPDTDAFDELEAVKGKMSEEEKRAVIRSEIGKVVADRHAHENVGGFALLKQPFSPDDGTLTRTMKPRRAVILEKYAAEVREVSSKLRRGG